MTKLFPGWMILGLLLVLHSSCFVLKRKGRKPADREPVAVIVQPADSAAGTTAGNDSLSAYNQALRNELLPYWNDTSSFGTFSSKVKVDFEGRGQKHDLVAHFRVKKDSIIWASVTAMGGVVQ
ncbi:MAG: hypothetical protein EOP49_04445, partial [Sphingobacteriales bacterium]